MSSPSTATQIFTGDGNIDFVDKRRTAYWATLAIIVVCLLGITLRGFNLGIDFEGGTKMNMPAANLETSQVEETFTKATGVDPEQVQIVGSGDTRILEINSKRLTQGQIDAARQALFDAYKPVNSAGQQTPDAIGDSTVSESWGSTITNRMLMSMGVFLIAAFAYIAIRLQREMAVAAILALFVDLITITGLYAIAGFEVTPATVIGLLTVLAFSLYDTVIVFDKVRENTAGYLGNNLAINQTVMRSISTTVISVLPILALMIVAVWLMGVGTLKDLALIQLIGVIWGTVSSIFLATPFLVSIKNRTKECKEHNAEVAEFRARLASGETAEEAEAEEIEKERSRAEAAAAQRRGTGTERPAGPSGSGTSWRPGHNN